MTNRLKRFDRINFNVSPDAGFTVNNGQDSFTVSLVLKDINNRTLTTVNRQTKKVDLPFMNVSFSYSINDTLKRLLDIMDLPIYDMCTLESISFKRGKDNTEDKDYQFVCNAKDFYPLAHKAIQEAPSKYLSRVDKAWFADLEYIQNAELSGRMETALSSHVPIKDLDSYAINAINTNTVAMSCGPIQALVALRRLGFEGEINKGVLASLSTVSNMSRLSLVGLHDLIPNIPELTIHRFDIDAQTRKVIFDPIGRYCFVTPISVAFNDNDLLIIEDGRVHNMTNDHYYPYR